jgi:uncharacterized membrane protein
MSALLFRAVSGLSIAVAAYAVIAYACWPVGTVLHPDVRASFAAHSPAVLLAHVFGASVALVLGPMLFWSQLRARCLRLHRWLGRAYLGLGVLIGGSSGAVLAWHAYGGPWSRAGFLSLALAWLGSGAVAWRKIRYGDVAAHRRWMARNLALSLAAVSLRIGLPALVACGVAMPVAYPWMAWLCWLPQAAWVEWRLWRGAGPAVTWPASARAHAGAGGT